MILAWSLSEMSGLGMFSVVEGEEVVLEGE